MTPEKIIIIAGGGDYPRLIIEGARRAGVKRVDLVSVKGSTLRATIKAADFVYPITLGDIAAGIKWVAKQGYYGAILAGQINPLSLFRGRFDDEVKQWLKELPVKNAHTVYGKLSEKFELNGIHTLPATCYMDDALPGEGVLTARAPTEAEQRDLNYGAVIVRDMGRHDVGQTVLVREGMVLAVEAFEGTNACIKRGGKLGGGHAVMFKGARVGHDMRFDVPVIGLKTLKKMRRYGVTALAFQAGRLLMLDRAKVIAYANRYNIAISGMATDLPPAPTRPE